MSVRLQPPGAPDAISDRLHDVVVVGAGPAGGQLAANLARLGFAVVLVDQLTDLEQAAFSSAGVPISVLSRYGLPAQVVASRCHGWQVLGPGDADRRWQASSLQAVVLEFGQLRLWLADQCRLWGGTVLLGRRALGHTPLADGRGVLTHLRNRGGAPETLRSRWLVDATGQARALLGDPPAAAGALVQGLGVEWLLRVSPEQWKRWQDRLSFCIGSDWIPNGYGWVFPMQAQQLKVGICRYHASGEQGQHRLGPALQALLQRTGLRDGVVLDRHGGVVRSTIRRREPHRRGPLLGLGDVVSTANLLGGEGIRHALCSAEVLTPLLASTLQRQRSGQSLEQAEQPLLKYSDHLKRALGWRWSLSGRIARRTWMGLESIQADQRLEQLFRGLEKSRAEEISALLFGYQFERYGWRALPYLFGWR